MKRTILFCVLTLATPVVLANSIENISHASHVIYNARGSSVFELRLYNPGHGEFGDKKDNIGPSKRSFDLLTTERLRSSAQYWADIIKVMPGNNPVIINIGMYDEINAYGVSNSAQYRDGSGTLVHAILNNGVINSNQLFEGGAHAEIGIGKMDWDLNQPFVPSQLIQTSKVDMASVLIHELVHAFGIGANTIATTASGKIDIKFSPILNNWSTHLVDRNGKKAAAGQTIICNFCTPAAAGADTFDVGDGFAYFSGGNVSEVLNGAMQGLPVRIDSKLKPGELGQPFSHIELRNSMMSHQNYRNYYTLMEAEFAALQDLGYSIDRRNLFGYSVYNDGITLINDNPFYARNNAGTAYIANSYNTATMGLGLHVYGSDNTIYQRAGLLSTGAGAAGIRVDGIGNDMTILAGTRVHANGVNGLGVLFAYGKNHSFTQRGDVQAMGENGIAIAFDFGHNSIGDDTEYRGSYFVTSTKNNLPKDFADYYKTAMDEVNGPLVSRFDLTGRIAGQKAAIFMSESGYVGEINVMQGASITGDIISEYKQRDERGDLRLTDLSFGLKTDSEGHSTSVTDTDFRLVYNGNILGSNIDLNFAGGTTVLTGNHNIHDVTISKDAVLAAYGEYNIDNVTPRFNNNGTLYAFKSDNPIIINGDYIQSADATFQLAFNDKQQTSQLIVNGHADLNGTISFTPELGYYSDDITLKSEQWHEADSTTGWFNKAITSLNSPTLTATITDNGNQSYTIAFNRVADAYSQYAANGEDREVGLALDNFINTPVAEIKPLIAAMDFSEADGSTIRSSLPQLSGEAYASARGVLVNASSEIRSSVNNRLSQAFGGASTTSISVTNGENSQASSVSDYEAWGAAYGSWTDQSAHKNAAKTKSTIGGLVTGIDGSINDSWRVGVMIGYGHSTFKTPELSSSGSSDNYTIGAYAGTDWATDQGSIGFRSGLSYSWHQMEMKRSIAFNGYSDRLSADYDAGTFQVFGELGYKYNLSNNLYLEPYANLSYVNVRTDSFTEKGYNGAALSVRSGKMNTTLSTLGMRVFSNFDLGETLVTARADVGWRHAFGKITPTSTARFAAGSNAFTSSGSPIGKNMALIEAGLDFALSKDTKLGISYQGQFGSGAKQNGININFIVRF